MPGFFEIGISLFLLFLCAGFSLWKTHKLERDFLIGGVRSILQLLLLGYVLMWIFRHNHALVIFSIGVLMTFNAANHSKSRIQVKYPRLLLDNFLSIALAIWPLAFVGSALLHSTPLWKVEIFLPLLGMLLGNTLNGISLGVESFGSELKARKEEVISLIALGATEDEATSEVMLKAMRIAMTPMMNAMASMGIVSIPGMMTGQLLAGQAPAEAAVVQIIIVLLIAVGTYAGTYLALLLSRRQKFLSGGVPCFG